MRDDMPTLIIDSHYIGYQARYVLGDMNNGDIATGVIFGFLSRILSLGLLFETNNIICCWDSKKSYRRRKFIDYKRKKLTEEEIKDRQVMMDQLTKLRRKILPKIGFKNNFIQVGCESDDIMAKIVCGKLGDFIIVTADADLFQVLFSNVKIYNPSKKKMMTRMKFKKEYGITPEHWVRVKQLAGCTSDKVPGIRGVGEKTALKYLLGTLPEKAIAYQKIRSEEGLAIRKRNKYLVKLPIKETIEPVMEHNHFSLDGFIDVCEEYGFESFLTEIELNKWRELFEIHIRQTPQPRYNKIRRR